MPISEICVIIERHQCAAAMFASTCAVSAIRTTCATRAREPVQLFITHRTGYGDFVRLRVRWPAGSRIRISSMFNVRHHARTALREIAAIFPPRDVQTGGAQVLCHLISPNDI